MSRTPIITGMTIVVLLIVGNYFVSRHFVRVDLTDNQAYTLADSTKEQLRSLPDVVTVRVYFTTALPPQLTPMKRGVEDILAEYRSYGGNNFQVEYRDPQMDQQTEREVMVMGIRPLELNVVEKDKQEVARVYLGLVLLYGDKKEVIQIDPRNATQHLEEWMTSAIYKLTRAKEPQIGWWVNDGATEGQGFALVERLLRDRYTLQTIDTADPTLDAAMLDGVVLVAPSAETFQEKQRKALEEYLAAGGKVVAFLNRIAIAESLQTAGQETGLESLLSAYGVTLQEKLVADAESNVASFQTGVMTLSMPYPLWPIVREGLNREHPVVSKLESLTLPWASPFAVAEALPEGVTVDILARSSQRSGLTPGTPPFSLDPQASNAWVPHTRSGGYPLALAVHGASSGELYLIGTAHLLEDRFVGQRQFQEGVTFFANMIDHVSIGDVLIGIRSRPVTSRPIPTDLTSGTKAMIRYSHVLGVPLLVILGGFGGMSLRRRHWRKMREQYRG